MIFVNGAVEVVPDAWIGQLAEGGRLTVVVDEGVVRRARVYIRSGGKSAWRAPVRIVRAQAARFRACRSVSLLGASQTAS